MTNLLPDTVEVLDRLGHLTSTGEVANSGSAFILRWTAFVVGVLSDTRRSAIAMSRRISLV
jgi:hypothetical protein